MAYLSPSGYYQIIPFVNHIHYEINTMIAAQSRIFPILLFATLSSFFLLGTQIHIDKDDTIKVTEKKTQKVGKGKNFNPVIFTTEKALKVPLPDFAKIANSQEKKQQFFSFLYPMVVHINEAVLHEREKIIILQNTNNLSSNDEAYLHSIAKKYRVNTSKGFNSVFFTDMLIKIDRIPPSLVLAQAANESAWGTSRFATKGNNLFGQWCFSKGCGVVPEQRNDDASHEVSKFDSVFDSIESYVLNLNRHTEYKQLRAIRHEIRSTNKPVSGEKLANGLEGYSERGLEYVNEIQSMIRFNNLSSLDTKA